MNKHRYQAKELQRVDWTRLAEDVIGQRLVFSVDVAKEDFYRAFMVSPSEANTVRHTYCDITDWQVFPGCPD